MKHFKHGASATERSILLNKIAQVIEDNLEYLATVETIDNGKAIRETMAADIPGSRPF
jgi:aldehyde dehydrogenase